VSGTLGFGFRAKTGINRSSISVSVMTLVWSSDWNCCPMSGPSCAPIPTVQESKAHVAWYQSFGNQMMSPGSWTHDSAPGGVNRSPIYVFTSITFDEVSLPMVAKTTKLVVLPPVQAMIRHACEMNDSYLLERHLNTWKPAICFKTSGIW
jgi:hypothetical protein